MDVQRLPRINRAWQSRFWPGVTVEFAFNVGAGMARAAVWKSRPVFITSMFLDMQAERSYLRTQVFPALGEWLRTKRLPLEWIDLRHGVAKSGVGGEAAR